MRPFLGYLVYVCVITGICGYFIARSKNRPPKIIVIQAPENATPAPSEGSIVRLVKHDTGKTFCSGSVVGDTTIITAGHCLVEINILGMASLAEDQIDIRRNDNLDLGIKARAVWVTSQLDQGILKGDFRKLEKRPFTSDIHGILDARSKKMMSCGYPMGGKLFCSPFEFINTDGFAWDGYGTLIPGMSGGPTMTLDGTQVGINVAVDGPYAIVSPIWNISDFFGEDKK